MKVEQLMTQDVHTVTSQDALSEAARIMWERDCGSVPVVDQGKLVGIITDRDCCMAAHLNDQKLSALQVKHHMSSNVFTIGPDEDVARAEQIMRDRQIRRLPVVDRAGRLRGMLALADLARGQSEGRARREKLQPGEVASTLLGVSQERGASAGASHA